MATLPGANPATAAEMYSQIVLFDLWGTLGLRSLVWDRSAEIVAGDKLHIPHYKLSNGFADYTPGTDATMRTVTDADNELSLDQTKSLVVQVDMTNERQVRASLQGTVSELMRRDYVDTIEGHVRTTITGASVSSGTTGTGQTDTVANWGAKAGRGKLMSAITEMDRISRSKWWPLDRRFMLTGLYNRERIIKYFTEDNPNAGTGAKFDMVFEDGTFGDMVMGFRAFFDPNFTDDLDTATDTTNIFFGVMGETVHFGQAIDTMSVKPVPQRNASNLEWYIKYGADVIDDERIGKVALTAS